MWALALGFAAIYLRGQRLGTTLDKPGIEAVLRADNAWGIAAILWVTSGLARLLYLEKSRAFYFRNGVFWIKMALFVAILLLELAPMIAFIRWRIQLAKGQLPDVGKAPAFRTICRLQLALLCVMPVAAAFMARGAWLF